MALGLKIVCGLYALLMLLMGCNWWFDFAGMAEGQSIQALSNLGQNHLTADLGALFFGTAIIIGLGLRPGRSFWLLSAAVLMLVAAVGRLYSFATLGYEAGALVPLIFEVASAAVLWFAHTQLSKSA